LEEDEDSSFANPALPDAENWSYLHQLELEKSVLGFYLTGHPLSPYKDLVELLTTPRKAIEERSNGKEICLLGVVTTITRKRDNKGNPMAFVEMEDMSGRFEVSLFKKDFDKYATQFEAGKVFFIIGSRSQYNAGDDNSLKVLPKQVIAFESLPYRLKGEVTISTEEEKINEEFLEKINRLKKQSTGHMNLKLQVRTKEFNQLVLRPQELKFYPDSEFISWCRKHDIELKAVVQSNE